MIYKLILSIRDARYRKGTRSARAEVPTVCVGNITVGGTGKTPHTEMLLRELLESDRWRDSRIAVLSRGYKRRSKGFQQLPYDASAALYGDEPVQIKRKFPAVTVAVDKNRVEGCSILVHPEKAASIKRCKAPDFPPSDIIVLDDAYQYRKLKADLNIVLSDWNRPVTTDSLLPGGRLRDLKRRLYDCDAVIVTKCPYELDAAEKAEAARILGYDSYDDAACVADRNGKSQLLLFSRICYGRPEPVFPDADSRYTYSQKMVLFSGIADDTQLRNYLSDSYKIVESIKFPDHHRYGGADVRALLWAVKRNPTAVFMTTEKDAQRLRDIGKMPPKLKERLFYQPISVEFLSEQERKVFIDKLITL